MKHAASCWCATCAENKTPPANGTYEIQGRAEIRPNEDIRDLITRGLAEGFVKMIDPDQIAFDDWYAQTLREFKIAKDGSGGGVRTLYDVAVSAYKFGLSRERPAPDWARDGSMALQQIGELLQLPVGSWLPRDCVDAVRALVAKGNPMPEPQLAALMARCDILGSLGEANPYLPQTTYTRLHAADYPVAAAAPKSGDKSHERPRYLHERKHLWPSCSRHEDR